VASRNKDLIDLARLHLTFTGLPHQGDRVARVVRFIALWLPPLTVAVATLLDLIPVIVRASGGGTPETHIGPTRRIVGHFVVLVIEFLVLVSIAQASTSHVWTIDKELH